MPAMNVWVRVYVLPAALDKIDQAGLAFIPINAATLFPQRQRQKLFASADIEISGTW